MSWVEVERTEDEIEELYNRAANQISKGSKWPGMTYEQGVRATLDWLTDPTEQDPLEDE